MKIYRLPVDSKLRPSCQHYLWPPSNWKDGADFGTEQDFEWWIEKQDLLVDGIGEADWLYLPVFFNRYYINVVDENSAWGGGQELLQECIRDALGYGMPTFTISEADEKILHPDVDWGNLVMFMGSRRGDTGIDIPLLSYPHIIPDKLLEKHWLASFVGNLATDGVRIDMDDKLRDRSDCSVENAENGEDYFVDLMLNSYIALCPRGQGAQSFRMYEAMQLGTVPLYISDIDCRPFKNWIDWGRCSIYMESVDKINFWLDLYNEDKALLENLGYNAKYTYDNFLRYQKWCKFVIKELELL